MLVETVEASDLNVAQTSDAIVKTVESSSIPLFKITLYRIFTPLPVKESKVFNGVVAGSAIQASIQTGKLNG